MLIGIFFFMSIQLVFLGVMGEYVGAIYTQVQKRPYAVELERINFDNGFGLPKHDPIVNPAYTLNHDHPTTGAPAASAQVPSPS